MEGIDQKGMMIKELIEGIEVAKQLREQIMISPTNDASRDDQAALNHLLIDKMLSSLDKTIVMAKMMGSIELPQEPSLNNDNNNNNSNDLQLESSCSLALSSPRSENSHHSPPKKRKTMPQWTKRVQVCAGGSVSGLERPLEDGFGWRKYGQKVILGAKFPRAYYRCTHRYSKGCAATKLVQQSDEDPSIYQIIYRGEHTCLQGIRLAQNQTRPKLGPIETSPIPQSIPNPQEEYQITQSPQEVFLGLGPEGDLKVEHVDRENEAHFFRSFSFTSALLETTPIDNYPAFGSPATLGSNYFLASSYLGEGLYVHTSDSDPNEEMLAPNSVTNSPIVVDFEFPLEQLLHIEANFPFEF